MKREIITALTHYNAHAFFCLPDTTSITHESMNFFKMSEQTKESKTDADGFNQANAKRTSL